MEKQTNHQDQNQPPPPPIKLEQSPRKPPLSGGDRLKRDEWSEGAVSTLLEAYESKWILRNRAKLKGQDWEDVAKHVSSRANGTKSPKTQTQCKNKIESMKKRYRSESAGNDTSSWPLFSRLDSLLRGSGGMLAQPPPLPALQSEAPTQTPPLLPQPPEPEPAVEVAENSHESNGVEPMAKGNEGVAAKSSDQVSDKGNQNHNENHHLETDSSTPALYSETDEAKQKRNQQRKRKRKRRRHGEDSSWDDVAESIRWLAEALLRSEQARMDTMREVERMRVEAEAKRGEMDLKRTEIIANTQLEIARIFASVAGKGVDPSLRMGKSGNLP